MVGRNIFGAMKRAIGLGESFFTKAAVEGQFWKTVRNAGTRLGGAVAGNTSHYGAFAEQLVRGNAFYNKTGALQMTLSPGVGGLANRRNLLMGSAKNWWKGGDLLNGANASTNRAVLRQGLVYGTGAAIGYNMIFGGRRRRR